MGLDEIFHEYGPWIGLLLVLALILFYERERVVNIVADLVGSSAKIREQKVAAEANRQHQESDLERRAWERVLSNGEWGRSLVDRIFMQADTHRTEATDWARSTERLAAEAVEVMQSFADVARMQADRREESEKRIVTVLERLDTTVSGVGFVLAKLYFQGKRGSWGDLMEVMKNEQGADYEPE